VDVGESKDRSSITNSVHTSEPVNDLRHRASGVY
jgi:hypothetical protein